MNRVPTHVWAVRGDTLVPIWLARELADRLGAPCSLTEVSSAFGHDAFLKEEKAVSTFLDQLLTTAPEPSNGVRGDTP